LIFKAIKRTFRLGREVDTVVPSRKFSPACLGREEYGDGRNNTICSGPGLHPVTVIAAVAGLLSLVACVVPSEERKPAQLADSSTYLKNEIPAAATKILEHADGFELLSLNPLPQNKAVRADFHGYQVLGRTAIADPGARKKLVSAFERGVAKNQGTIAACFNPRHGIHVTRGGEVEDFVVCFECLQVYSHGAVEGHFLTSSSPEALFDSMLRRAGIPLADK
jgi:hypothetical protein